MTVEERVAAGMAVLDEKAPGWLDIIDLAELDLGSGVHEPGEDCGCVLAQIDYDLHRSGDRERLPSPYPPVGPEGYYTCGLWHLTGLSAEWRSATERQAREWALAHGFLGDPDDIEDRNLTQAWRQAIALRRDLEAGGS